MRVPVTVGVLALVLATSTSSSSTAGATTSQPQGQQPGLSATFVRVYKSGTPGLADPIPVNKPSPLYTPNAMRAKVQGLVEIDVTVDANGRVRDALVATSLDTAHGLDEEAVKAASQWTFQPGRLNGTAVPVRLVLKFDLRLH